MKKFTVLVVLSMLLVGCALTRAGKDYSPFNGSSGYIDTPVSSDEYEVSYYSSFTLPNQYMKKMIIIRAAQIGDQIGASYFRLIEPEKEAIIESGVEVVMEEMLSEEQQAMAERKKTYSFNPVTEKQIESHSLLYRIKFEKQACDTCLNVRNVVEGAKRDGFIRK